MVKLVTMGSDPEFFLRDEKGNIVVGTPDIIPGTENERFNIGGGIEMHLDNVLAELTHKPATSATHMAMVSAKMVDNLSHFLAESGLCISKKTSHVFSPEDLSAPHCMKFGCKPDFSGNFWDTVPPISAETSNGLRTASGHMHFGFDRPLRMQEKLMLILILDLSVGLPLTVMHSDPQRRKLYGQASRFRSTDFGIEYRTPDNAWVFHPEVLPSRIYSVVFTNAGLINKVHLTKDLIELHKEVVQAINTGEGLKSCLAKVMETSPFSTLKVSDMIHSTSDSLTVQSVVNTYKVKKSRNPKFKGAYFKEWVSTQSPSVVMDDLDDIFNEDEDDGGTL